MDNIIEINESVKINKQSMEVFKEGENIKLKPKEYELLLAFAENRI